MAKLQITMQMFKYSSIAVRIASWMESEKAEHEEAMEDNRRQFLQQK